MYIYMYIYICIYIYIYMYLYISTPCFFFLSLIQSPEGESLMWTREHAA